MKVIDNFLSKSYFKEVSSFIESENFNWYYIKNIGVYYKDKENLDREFGFSHAFINENGEVTSQLANFLKPMFLNILDLTNKEKILRARAVMTNNVGKSVLYEKHVDIYRPHTAAIFYINESDGDTILYNQKIFTKEEFDNKKNDYPILKKISPKPNRLLVFNGTTLHSSVSPTKNNARIIINSNYE